MVSSVQIQMGGIKKGRRGFVWYHNFVGFVINSGSRSNFRDYLYFRQPGLNQFLSSLFSNPEELQDNLSRHFMGLNQDVRFQKQFSLDLKSFPLLEQSWVFWQNFFSRLSHQTQIIGVVSFLAEEGRNPSANRDFWLLHLVNHNKLFGLWSQVARMGQLTCTIKHPQWVYLHDFIFYSTRQVICMETFVTDGIHQLFFYLSLPKLERPLGNVQAIRGRRHRFCSLCIFWREVQIYETHFNSRHLISLLLLCSLLLTMTSSSKMHSTVDQLSQDIHNKMKFPARDDVDPLVITDRDRIASVQRWKFSLLAKIKSTKVWTHGFVSENIKRTVSMPFNMDVLPFSDGIYLLKFRYMSDMERVLYGGPWSVFGYLCVLKRWNPRLDASKISFQSDYFWVEFSNLDDFELQNYYVVQKIARQIGRVTKTYVPRTFPFGSQKPRARIEIDIDKPLVTSISVPLMSKERVLVQVEYVSKPSYYCRACSRLGHLKGKCPYLATEAQAGIPVENRFSPLETAENDLDSATAIMPAPMEDMIDESPRPTKRLRIDPLENTMQEARCIWESYSTFTSICGPEKPLHASTSTSFHAASSTELSTIPSSQQTPDHISVEPLVPALESEEFRSM